MKYGDYECPNPFKALIYFALVDTVVAEVNETIGFESRINARRNLRAISSRTMEKGAKIY
jgi:hypothetical protein